MTQAFKGKIDIQGRPVKVSSPWHFHGTDVRYGSVPEPGEMFVVQKYFLIFDGKPDSKPGDLHNLNRGSDCSRHV